MVLLKKLKSLDAEQTTLLSDHYSVIIDTNIKKNKQNIVTKIIRDTTKISPTHLMESYTQPTFKPDDIIDLVYNQFREELIKMLDAVAPQKIIKTEKP